MMRRLARRVALGSMVLAMLGAAPGAAPSTLEYRLYRQIETPIFTVTGFVLSHLPRVLSQSLASPAAASGDEQVVRRFAEGANRERLEPLAERALAAQVSAVLDAEGLGLGLNGVFPPVSFVFREPPLMLIVSPREQIALRAAVPLDAELSAAEMATVEARAEELGVSALVVRIGGLATYPAMLPPSGDIPWLLEAVAHEWVHNYFTLRPLGWRYALGLERDPAVITINETAADLIGREVARAALARFYGATPPAATQPATGSDPRAAYFRSRMRAIRAHVDTLLAAGRVAEAERYMETERQALVAEGFSLRRLNQAYFAFHGSYADGPAGRLDPVVSDVRRLREQSPSLRAFAEAVSGVASAAELRALVAR
jgi:hypothetical protein